MQPDTAQQYHRVCLIIFRVEDRKFFKFLHDEDTKDDLKDMFKTQKLDYDRENEKKETAIMAIDKADLSTIYDLGQFVHYEPRLHSYLAYFWTLLSNCDRSAEKLEPTKLEDFKFEKYEEIWYVKRDPRKIQKKITNKKTERSFGLWVFIPNGPVHQPYNIIQVSYES